MLQVRPQRASGALISSILIIAGIWTGIPCLAAQEPAKWDQVLKEAGELQVSQPQAVAEKLAPLLADLRAARQKGALGPDAAKILQDALLLLMRNQYMLLLPEVQIAPVAREILVTNPVIDSGIFNPRERILIDKIRAAETGQFSVQSVPPGAALYYMGTEMGKAPAEFPLIAGDYHWKMALPGYHDQEFEVTVRPAETVSETRTMRRRTVEIPVAVNAPSVAVTLNGRSLGTTQGYNAWIASLPAEKQTEFSAVVQQWNADKAALSFFRLQDIPVEEELKLDFQAACFQPVTVRITVAAAEVDWARPLVVRRELQRVELKRDVGFLEVSSTPAGAEVQLDGIFQGQTPMGKDVCVGAHTVQVWHRSGQYVQEVNIRRGQASKVDGEMKPALAFLGIFARNPQTRQPTPLAAEWEAAARKISLRSSAFADPRISSEDVEGMRKKGSLPVERLLQDGLGAAEIDVLVKQASAAAGRADLLLVGQRVESRYVFRLFSTIHPLPDVIEVPSLDDASLDFLTAQLNKAEQVGNRLHSADAGVQVMDSPKGLMILDAAAGKPPLAPGAIVKTVDQKPMNMGEFQTFVNSRKPGQTISLEVQTGRGIVATVPIPVSASGLEYPWAAPDGFPNAVLTMLRHIIERDPLSEDAKYAALSLARGIMEQGEWKLALEYLAKTNLGPGKTGVCPGTVLYYQGCCFEELGDRAQAESYYLRAKDYADATIGRPGGPSVPVLAEQRIQAMKK